MTKALGGVLALMLSLVLVFAQLDPRLAYVVVKPNSRVEFFVRATLGDIDGVFSSYDVEFNASTPRFEDSSFRLEVAGQSLPVGREGDAAPGFICPVCESADLLAGPRVPDAQRVPPQRPVVRRQQA